MGPVGHEILKQGKMREAYWDQYIKDLYEVVGNTGEAKTVPTKRPPIPKSGHPTGWRNNRKRKKGKTVSIKCLSFYILLGIVL